MSPEEVIQKTIDEYRPERWFVGFSGGRDSIVATHWMMSNVQGCEVVHCNTGIGIEKTRSYVRETCADYGWPLHEIFAKEDCGMDYDEIVLESGFPGPSQHMRMYIQLKERCIEKLVRDNKTHRMGKIVIATGIRHDESMIRAGYTGREVTQKGAQVWVNPLYSWNIEQFNEYRCANNLPHNEVTDMLGFSGECLCGAYAAPGELARIRAVEPATADRIERLQIESMRRGRTWSYEGHPPKGGYNKDQMTIPFEEQPMCVGCNAKVGNLINYLEPKCKCDTPRRDSDGICMYCDLPVGHASGGSHVG